MSDSSGPLNDPLLGQQEDGVTSYIMRGKHMGMAYLVLDHDGTKKIHIHRNLGDMSLLNDIGEQDPEAVLDEWFKTVNGSGQRGERGG
jgi:hypothetical protein